MKISDDPNSQGTAEWLYSRCGYITASRFGDVLAVTKKGEPTAARTSYMWDMIAERLTGIPTEHYVTAAMQQGTDREPLARMAYEATTGAMVHEVGFIHHPTLDMVGGSPDGLVGNDGMIEIKCPTIKTHLQTVLSGDCAHLPQIQGMLWITGRAWCDFVSYEPTLAVAGAGLALHIQRIGRDEEFIGDIANAVLRMLEEVDEYVERLVTLGSGK